MDVKEYGDTKIRGIKMGQEAIIKKISGDRFTPFLLAKKLGAKAVLESASFLTGKDRYSIIMIDEAFRLVQRVSGVVQVSSGEEVQLTGDILYNLAEVAKQNKTVLQDADDKDGEMQSKYLPLPGAGLGYLGYEFCARCDTIVLSDQKDALEIPESCFIIGHMYIIFDHFTEMMYLVGMNYKEHQINLRVAADTIEKRIFNLDFTYLSEPEEGKSDKIEILTDLEKTHDEYVQKVVVLKEEIKAGNIIQAVPSRRLQIKDSASALEIYRRLRQRNPSPYMFYLNFGDFQLVGASPESLVRVRKGVATIHPIAGTRRRGKNLAEDESLSEELARDPKERAEHLMLVDLARNDLGRVCEDGSIKVTKFMACEKYSTVIHLVSEVTGKTVSGDTDTAVKILRASFPAGTVSGAPKISAIQILSKLEKEKRNFYAGAVGYLSVDGDLDFCIAIRCALKKEGVWTLQAGGGIVYASLPEREWTETCEKIDAMKTLFFA